MLSPPDVPIVKRHRLSGPGVWGGVGVFCDLGFTYQSLSSVSKDTTTCSVPIPASHLLGRDGEPQETGDVVPGRGPGEPAEAGPAAGVARNSDSTFDSDAMQLFALCALTHSQLFKKKE